MGFIFLMLLVLSLLLAICAVQSHVHVEREPNNTSGSLHSTAHDSMCKSGVVDVVLGSQEQDDAPLSVPSCMDNEHGRHTSSKRVQVLNACSRRGICDDWLHEGAILSLLIDGARVFVVRENGKRVGMLPPEVSDEYIACAPCYRYKKVIVERDTNLNDKYGQLFVRPLTDLAN